MSLDKHQRRALNPTHMSAHVGARTPAATCPLPSALQIPAAGLANARDWPLTCRRLPYPSPPRKRRAAAGHAEAGGNPPRKMAAAGRTNASGSTPAPLLTSHESRWFHKLRKPRSHRWSSTMPATSDAMCHRRQYRHRRQHTSTILRTTRPPPVLSTPSAKQEQVEVFLARLSPPKHAEAPMPIPTPAATHQHPSPPDTRAACLFNAGGGAGTRRSLFCTPPTPKHAEPPPAIPTPVATHQHPSPPDTRAACLSNAGGGAGTIRSLSCTPPALQHAQPPLAIPTPVATYQHPFPPDTRTAGLFHAGGGAGTRSSLSCTPPALQHAQPPLAIPAPVATHQHPSPPDTRAAGLFNAGNGAGTSRSLSCTPPPPKHAEPPPAIPSPAATHQHPFPTDTRAACLSNAGGGSGTSGSLSCTPPPPPTRRAAVGGTDVGGNPFHSLPAAHMRRRSRQRLRRGSHIKTSTLSAAPQKDPLLTTLSMEETTLRSRVKGRLFYSLVGRKKRASPHPHVFSKVMPQALVLLLVFCLRPSVQYVAETSGRKRAGRRNDRGGHTRQRVVAAARTVRIAL